VKATLDMIEIKADLWIDLLPSLLSDRFGFIFLYPHLFLLARILPENLTDAILQIILEITVFFAFFPLWFYLATVYFRTNAWDIETTNLD
jgi:hypothetical protein